MPTQPTPDELKKYRDTQLLRRDGMTLKDALEVVGLTNGIYEKIKKMKKPLVKAA